MPDDVFMERVADEIVFLDLSDHSYYGLDPIAARMMELLLVEPSIAEVVSALAAEYDATEDVLSRDVQSLVDQLVETGLAERADPKRPAGPVDLPSRAEQVDPPSPADS